MAIVRAHYKSSIETATVHLCNFGFVIERILKIFNRSTIVDLQLFTEKRFRGWHKTAFVAPSRNFKLRLSHSPGTNSIFNGALQFLNVPSDFTRSSKMNSGQPLSRTFYNVICLSILRAFALNNIQMRNRWWFKATFWLLIFICWREMRMYWKKVIEIELTFFN